MQTFRIVKTCSCIGSLYPLLLDITDDAFTPVSERTLPVGCMQLVFHKGRQLVSLQNSHNYNHNLLFAVSLFGFSDVMSTGMIEMITVVFQPYAAKTFLRIPLHLFFGQNISTDEVEDTELSDLSRRIVDTRIMTNVYPLD